MVTVLFVKVLGIVSWCSLYIFSQPLPLRVTVQCTKHTLIRKKTHHLVPALLEVGTYSGLATTNATLSTGLWFWTLWQMLFLTLTISSSDSSVISKHDPESTTLLTGITKSSLGELFTFLPSHLQYPLRSLIPSLSYGCNQPLRPKRLVIHSH